MAYLQPYFEAFHEAIKMGRFEHNQELRDKRDILRDRLRRRLPAVFDAAGEACPRFDFRDQGSYSLGTGVLPLDGDVDIDQGLYFDVSVSDYPDPVVLKCRVRDALAGHTRGDGSRPGVVIRRPCVTVRYHVQGQPLYHVDLAVYSAGARHRDGKPRLAVGRERSADENCYWEPSEPLGLNRLIRERFEQPDIAQFRRIVRYLKRWKDLNFSADGNEAPLGVALTTIAYEDLRPAYDAGEADDAKALAGLVRALIQRFNVRHTFFLGTRIAKIRIDLPVEPRSDLCERMTDRQATAFLTKLEQLASALKYARRARLEGPACERLQEVFGYDFPAPGHE